MKIYAIRHGETDWNSARKVQGVVDIPLNEKGREQASGAIDNVREIIEREGDFSAAYSSPLARARETAEIVTEGRVKIIDEPLLLERSFGKLEGMYYGEPGSPEREKFGGVIDFIDEGGENSEDVETIAQMIDRAKKFIEKLKNEYDDEARILVVAHAGILKVLWAVIDGRDVRIGDEHWGNCEIKVKEV